MEKKKLQAMDGTQACAYVAYAFTEVAGIYPITPSSPIAEHIDEWAAQGKKNLFGMPVKVVEMQSEAGAAGSVHGSLQAGALTSTFTASQGLLLKIPNMYKMAGQMLPAVIHVTARSIAAQALSIFGDHQDVMAARQTGFAMLFSSSVQEVMDLSGVAHLAAIETGIPFMHIQDGFRTSHEVNTIETIDYEVFDKLLDRDKVKEFRQNSLNPLHPKTRGSAQNDDVYFQTRELQNTYYRNVDDVVEKYMEEITKATNREYHPFTYYGDKEATDIIVALGSVNETIKETVDYLMKQGKKVGAVNVHLYRPFSSKYFFKVVPNTVKRIAVLDRTIEPGSLGEPLYLDIKALYYGRENAPLIIGGRYGLSSKDTTPSMINAVYENLANEQKDRFTIGITDDVTYKSLDVKKQIDVVHKDTTELLFYGFGSDGTVGASKNTIKIIGDNTDYYAQAYASYDSKKSGGVTRMHLRFGKEPIRSTYLVNEPHFVSCSTDSYLTKYDMLKGLRQNGTFLLNTVYNKDEIIKHLPNKVKKQLAEKNAKFYIINAVDLAAEIGLGRRINTIMQSAFFKLNEHIMPYDKANTLMKEYAKKTYSKKGEQIVELNYKAIDAGSHGLVKVDVDPSWKNLKEEEKVVDAKRPSFVSKIADVINSIEGDSLPLSAFLPYKDSHIENGTAAYEKRGVANEVSSWIPENCIQCNQCVFVCPHACIRSFLVDEEEAKNAPENSKMIKATGKGLENHKFTIQVSILDCTGCGVCVNVCPGKGGKKALDLKPIQDKIAEKGDIEAEYFYDNVSYKGELAGDNLIPKNLGFYRPFFEYSGACAGCGETSYIKTVTQLFGDHMIVANATGCTSIYSASYPSAPYTVDEKGHGPAWANSLFEDNAEFGFGMHIAKETIRDRIQNILFTNLDKMDDELKELANEWMLNRNSSIKTKKLYPLMVKKLESVKDVYAKELLDLKDYFIKVSQWIIGGDGWAYDIGFGGLDHVIASNEDVNILILDTEVYSNTGGQSSKSARVGAIAKFAAAGKPTKKKDLAALAMSYGHVYVAQISHGYSQMQMVKALKEAEAYNGPSIVIAYSPCIAHNIKGGLFNSIEQAKLATECGYWPIFRYNPVLEEQGKNPFTIDSREPKWEKYHDFLMNEGRYSQLYAKDKDKADQLLKANMHEAQRRYRMYKRYKEMDYSNEVEETK